MAANSSRPPIPRDEDGYPLKQYIYDSVRLQEGPLDTPCWFWKRSKQQGGYGQVCFYRNSKTENWGAHRLTYFLFNKETFDPDLVILHQCDVSSCCNPDHMRQGTHIDNILEAMERNDWYSRRRLLTPREVRRIRSSNSSVADLARDLNVHYSVVRHVKLGETYKWVEQAA